MNKIIINNQSDFERVERRRDLAEERHEQLTQTLLRQEKEVAKTRLAVVKNDELRQSLDNALAIARGDNVGATIEIIDNEDGLHEIRVITAPNQTASITSWDDHPEASVRVCLEEKVGDGTSSEMIGEVAAMSFEGTTASQIAEDVAELIRNQVANGGMVFTAEVVKELAKHGKVV